MTHPIRIPKNARYVPPATKLPDKGRETWEWIVSQGLTWHISEDSPLWFAGGYMYAYRLAIRYPDPHNHRRLRSYELDTDRLNIRTRLVGYPVRGLPPILSARETA